MSGTVSFTVMGRCRPQGSKRAFVNRHTGRAQMVEQSAHVGDWRARVAYAAGEACPGQFQGVPVGIHLTCVFERPKGHYRSGRFSHLLVEAAPTHPITRSTGDADKLARAVLDSLTGPVLSDDSLVCELIVAKVYGLQERLEVRVSEVRTAPYEVERAAVAPCPCGEPAPEGYPPCTPEKPCPYAEGMPRERWST